MDDGRRLQPVFAACHIGIKSHSKTNATLLLLASLRDGQTSSSRPVPGHGPGEAVDPPAPGLALRGDHRRA